MAPQTSQAGASPIRAAWDWSRALIAIAVVLGALTVLPMSLDSLV